MSDADEEERRKREEKEKKKADVRKRLEAASKANKPKGKGFMTPERKKKLRLLLRKMAAEELKKEQEKKAQERRRIIHERIGEAKSLDGANEPALMKILQEYQKKIESLEDSKYDLEYCVRQKDFEINELSIAVNDLRGKFVKPALKKVSKYDQKFAKMNMKMLKAAELNFRTTLKTVEKDKFKIEEDGKEAKEKKPEWALGAKGEKVEGGKGDEETEE